MAFTNKEQASRVKRYLSAAFKDAADIVGFGLAGGTSHVTVYGVENLPEQRMQEIRDAAKAVLDRPLLESELVCVPTGRIKLHRA